MGLGVAVRLLFSSVHVHGAIVTEVTTSKLSSGPAEDLED